MFATNKRIMPIREMYIMLIIIMAALFGIIYTSMALFEKEVEKVGVATIAASEIDYILTSTEVTDLDDKNSTITVTVPAGEVLAFDIEIKNNTTTNTKYKMYYSASSITNYTSIIDTEIGIACKIGNESTCESSKTNLISANSSKTVRTIIKNGGSSSTTVEIGAQGGYSNNEVVLKSDRNEFNITTEVPTFIDTSGANEPLLATNNSMIPVVYDEDLESWVKADTEFGWYNYDEQVWANAVTVTNSNRSTYLSSDPGTPISMNDINSMWVWIPRYYYKIDSSSSTATPSQVTIEFESGTTTTYSNTTNTGVNTTHPSFRKGETMSSSYAYGGWTHELTGYWVSKFELGGTTNSSAISTVLIKPNIPTLYYLNSSNVYYGFNIKQLYEASQKFTETDNSFGLPTTVTSTTDASGSHMIKNTEWGAVALLSQSKYGKMGNSNYTGTNKEIYFNNMKGTSGNFGYTGRSGGSPTAAGSTYGTYSYDGRACNSYNCSTESITDIGKLAGYGASTTGTIYGIYDMNGGSSEYVMAYSAKTPNSDSGFTSSTIASVPNYLIDRYPNTTGAYIIGDATSETSGWYGDYMRLLNGSSRFYRRGGSAYDTSISASGIFNAGPLSGTGVEVTSDNGGVVTTRVVLITK